MKLMAAYTDWPLSAWRCSQNVTAAPHECRAPAARVYRDTQGEVFGYCALHLPILRRLVRYGYQVTQVFPALRSAA